MKPALYGENQYPFDPRAAAFSWLAAASGEVITAGAKMSMKHLRLHRHSDHALVMRFELGSGLLSSGDFPPSAGVDNRQSVALCDPIAVGAARARRARDVPGAPGVEQPVDRGSGGSGCCFSRTGK